MRRRSFESGTVQRYNETSAQRSRLRSLSVRRRTCWRFASSFLKQPLNQKASVKTAVTTDRLQPVAIIAESPSQAAGYQSGFTNER